MNQWPAQPLLLSGATILETDILDQLGHTKHSDLGYLLCGEVSGLRLRPRQVKATPLAHQQGVWILLQRPLIGLQILTPLPSQN